MSRAVTVVKMHAVNWSRHFLGVGQVVKQCSGQMTIKRRGQAFVHAQLVAGQLVRGKNSSSQGHFLMVKNLDPGHSSGHGVM